ncbi:hypothetical protein A2962_03675 [Candidatus Woesebacteria bacterium RIFCSPLOWO2_01_FULL_39_61]|uniref:Uncharacterized protein n=1 Tax=Candidatus Woesebacteria bacterium RIFCSPHIGHO2_02_FULL_39_13 TaxID=1802505 RepID=A0A1F7Z2N8_9BACT|nr:MAG: hypothetical protein A2692_03855 [Candidatus Woesebacteria bacterium RIFCSPHIGHO2_01_FULL_39_95]OGM33791.1 MAG: hypothetical protein A3D01_02365 [Candidatus Woesebacteria bacterium RIFCSPHIGHO2_02_FULL_39_13]OGM38952.1 MAG: hypothetical protein A3E13_04635 [Candidatus Woesebacteria bacterium RIFCSPHIGHO2_12_FULL_40_20]OGM65600.1 MAG: hypothetical protein A2962_03675 [Candidatus Woesebacteria bacterium RIFCSPLOWO2_01_FULL_39_61]OGM72534.1 MAG: hypothetical protein A3H19_01155 [Candidatus
MHIRVSSVWFISYFSKNLSHYTSYNIPSKQWGLIETDELIEERSKKDLEVYRVPKVANIIQTRSVIHNWKISRHRNLDFYLTFDKMEK